MGQRKSIKRIVKLEGKRVVLGPIEKKDMGKFHQWLSDLDVAKYMRAAPLVLTGRDEEEWFENMRKKKDEVHFSIMLKNTNRLIGSISLKNINKTFGSAELGIMIGEKTKWSKGYGTEAIQLLLDFAFNVLRLHSVSLNVYDFNPRAIACYKKVGFKKAGKLREAYYFGGEYHNSILMDILEKEFKQSRLRGAA